MPSSDASTKQFWITAWVQSTMSSPSLFQKARLFTVTPSISRLSTRSVVQVQQAELRMLMPFRVTFRLLQR